MANEDQNNNNNKDDFQRGLLLDTKPKTKKPSMYNVLLLMMIIHLWNLLLWY